MGFLGCEGNGTDKPSARAETIEGVLVPGVLGVVWARKGDGMVEGGDVPRGNLMETERGVRGVDCREGDTDAEGFRHCGLG